MRSRKLALTSGTLAIVLCVVLYGAGLLRQRRKVTLTAEARTQIQKIYGSSAHLPSQSDSIALIYSAAAKEDRRAHFHQTRTIQKFSWRGDTAIAVVKCDESVSTDGLPSQKPTKVEVVIMQRDTWVKSAGKWLCSNCQTLKVNVPHRG